MRRENLIIVKSTPEEMKSVTKSVEKPFEFNRWYKHKDKDYHKLLDYITDDNKYYGFTTLGNWFYCFDREKEYSLGEVKEELYLATDEEVKEKLLSYAREKYPVGTVFNSLFQNYQCVIKDYWHFDDYGALWFTGSQGINGIVYKNGQWAEILSTPEVEKVSDERYLAGIDPGSDFDIEFQRNSAKMVFKPWQGIKKKEPNILDDTYQEVEIKYNKPKQIKL